MIKEYVSLMFEGVEKGKRLKASVAISSFFLSLFIEPVNEFGFVLKVIGIVLSYLWCRKLKIMS